MAETGNATGAAAVAGELSRPVNRPLARRISTSGITICLLASWNPAIREACAQTAPAPALEQTAAIGSLARESKPPKGDAPSPESADSLFEKFEQAPYFWQQGEIGRSLVSLGDPKIIAKVEKHLDASDRRRRCNAGMVLAGLGDQRGLVVIIRELEDKGPRPADLMDSRGKPNPKAQIVADRYYAAMLLGQLRSKEAVPPLIEATTDRSINNRAAISLGEIGDKQAIPALRKMAVDFPDRKLWAGYGLAALRQQDGFDFLAETALSDSRWTDRRHAVEALGKVGDSKGVPTVVKALRDEHSNVRASAAAALGQIGDVAAVPALTEALRDTDFTETNAPTTVAREAQKAIDAIRTRKR